MRISTLTPKEGLTVCSTEAETEAQGLKPQSQLPVAEQLLVMGLVSAHRTGFSEVGEVVQGQRVQR